MRPAVCAPDVQHHRGREHLRHRLGVHLGREDLLPAIFQRIVDELNVETGGGLEEFKYYLNRHIGLDGDKHGPMRHDDMQAEYGRCRKQFSPTLGGRGGSESRRLGVVTRGNRSRSGRIMRPVPQQVAASTSTSPSR